MAITLEKRNPTNVVLIVVLVLVACAAGYFYWSSTEAVKSRDQMSVRIGFLEEEKLKAAAELQKSKAELESYQKKVETLTQETAEAKKNQEIAEADVKRKVDEIAELQKNYEKRIEELESEIKQYADFNMLLTKSLEPIRAALGDPTAVSALQGSSAQNTGSGSAIPSIFSVESVNKPDARAEIAAGQVISVDREYGFVIANFGSLNGVKPGGLVELYRQDVLLGVGSVERVQDKISAISIISEDLRARIQESDRAVLIS